MDPLTLSPLTWSLILAYSVVGYIFMRRERYRFLASREDPFLPFFGGLLWPFFMGLKWLMKRYLPDER